MEEYKEYINKKVTFIVQKKEDLYPKKRDGIFKGSTSTHLKLLHNYNTIPTAYKKEDVIRIEPKEENVTTES
jgi:hypothetical protein